jgi:hypothetical protein
MTLWQITVPKRRTLGEVSAEYPDLSDYLAVASAVTGIEPSDLLRSKRLELADSGLHARAGRWGGRDLYPDFVDKAAVLLLRLAKNHPLLDGNKRAAWVSLRLSSACRKDIATAKGHVLGLSLPSEPLPEPVRGGLLYDSDCGQSQALLARRRSCSSGGSMKAS